ncbi:AIPR family protein [Micromonospora sp. NPDC051300]|uniref:AIPR family protein n=1 Tax=Micromonospora sp. NPDC051300 TaxID=3364286 RepID=UPI00378F584B
MASNEVVLLDAALKERREQHETEVPDYVIFERFVAEKVLRHADLSDEEIEAGNIGGNNDAGLDGAYTFLGEALLEEDDDLLSDETKPSDHAKGQTLTLWLIQAKTSNSFTENAIDLLASSLNRLLALAPDENSLQALYSSDILNRVDIFRRAWTKLATRQVKISVHVVYATKGDVNEINSKVRLKADELVATVKELIVGGRVSFDFWGARELWDAHNDAPSYTLRLAFQEQANTGSSLVALVRLSDYVKFLTDEDGSLRRHIFDWNVRDYQGGAIGVNREISRTLTDENAPEFWWLNNGVTILCSADISIVNKTYILEDVQIVNGLQTSHTVFKAMQNPLVAERSGNKAILVRILATNDPAVRDQVIRATNRQTNVPEASLRATEELQRKIESYFASNEWYYDRRKNFYRNVGKKAERIVSIPYLAQAVMAMGLSQPNHSRARPTSLLKKDEDYNRIFSEKVHLATFLWVVRNQKLIDAHLLKASDITSSERSNLKYYLSMLLVARMFGDHVRHTSQLNKIASEDVLIDEKDIAKELDLLRHLAQKFGEPRGFTLDRTAKNAEFASFVLSEAFPNKATGYRS